MAPAGTPRAIRERINKEVTAALSADQIQKKFRDVGVEPALPPGTSDEFGAFMSNEMVKWGKLIKDRGIKLE